MERSVTLRRLTALAAAAALALVVVAPPAGADTTSKQVHCYLQVTSVDPVSRVASTAPMVCSSTPEGARSAARAQLGMARAASYWIATHYAGYNFQGSTLTVTGPGCTGVFINVPAAWVDVISSTQSPCTVTHYDLFWLLGANATTFNPGGNLPASFDNRTNSAEYY